MHNVWIVVGVIVALFVLVLLIKFEACSSCFDCCGCCSECGDCCTVSSLPLFLIGVVALWGSGLAVVGWLVLSVIRS
jgi:hypothetical protein